MMNSKVSLGKILSLSIAGTMVVSSLALAQSSNTSTAKVEQKSTLEKVAEKIQFNYAGEFSGPSPARIDENFSTPGSDGQPQGSANLRNMIGLGYRINKEWVAGATADFLFQPWNPTAAFVLRDPWARIGTSKLVSYKSFTMSGDLRAYVPISNASQSKALFTGVRNTLFSLFEVPNTRVSFGHYSFIRGNIYYADGVLKDGNVQGTYFDSYLAAHLNFQVSPAVQLTLWSDVVSPCLSRTGAWDPFGVDLFNIQPKVNIDVTKWLTLTPYVKFYPTNLSWYSTSINLDITANFL